MRRRAEFTEVVRRGRRAGRPFVVAHLLTRPESTEPPRVGFVVSRAVGNSVVRNRVERRLRHILADRRKVLPAGSLLVVRANPRSAKASFHDLAADVDRVLHRLMRSGEVAEGAPTETKPSETGAGR
jgi:ribonuclease P protein component